MLPYLLVVITLGAALVTTAVYETVHIAILNGNCTPRHIVVLADQPVLMNIADGNRKITSYTCYNSDDATKFQSQDNIEHNQIMLRNTSTDLGRRWLCKYHYAETDGSQMIICQFNVRYRDKNEAVVLINDKAVETTQTPLETHIDGVVHYYFSDGDLVNVTCYSQGETNFTCLTVLQYLNSKGRQIAPATAVENSMTSNASGKCSSKFIVQKLTPYSVNNHFLCKSNGYLTMILLHLKALPTAYDYVPKRNSNNATQIITTEIPTQINMASNRSSNNEESSAAVPWYIMIGGLFGVCPLVAMIVITLIKRQSMSKLEDVVHEGSHDNAAEEPEYHYIDPNNHHPSVDTPSQARPPLDTPPEYDYSYAYDDIIPPPSPSKLGHQYSYAYDHRTRPAPRRSCCLACLVRDKSKTRQTAA